MRFLASGIFWGSVIVILGVSMILGALFRITIPVLEIVFAFVFIYLGLNIISGASGRSKKSTVLFAESTIKGHDKENEYAVVFGKGEVDLTGISKTQGIKVNTVFGESTVILNKNLSYDVRVSAVFSGVKTPDGDTTSFGQHEYAAKGKNGTKKIVVEVNAVFGSSSVVLK